MAVCDKCKDTGIYEEPVDGPATAQATCDCPRGISKQKEYEDANPDCKPIDREITDEGINDTAKTILKLMGGASLSQANRINDLRVKLSTVTVNLAKMLERDAFSDTRHTKIAIQILHEYLIDKTGQYDIFNRFKELSGYCP